MNVSGARTACAVAAAIFGLGCMEQGSVTAPEDPDVRFARPTCPGHPSCGDPPAPAGNATVELAGDVTTSSSQSVVISKDSKNHLAGSGGGEDFTIVDALSLFAAAGSPSPAALGGCVTDPPDLESTDAGAVQRLIDRLTDTSQSRTLRFQVNKRAGEPDRDPQPFVARRWRRTPVPHPRDRILPAPRRPDGGDQPERGRVRLHGGQHRELGHVDRRGFGVPERRVGHDDPEPLTIRRTGPA